MNVFAKILFCLFLCGLSHLGMASEAAALESNQIKTQEAVYEHNFTTTIFDSYINQLIIKAESIRDFPQEIKVILYSHAESAKENRFKHEQLITILREFVNNNNNFSLEVNKAINEFCFAIFAEMNLIDEHLKFLGNQIDISDESLEAQPIFWKLKEALKELESMKKFGGYIKKEDSNIADLHFDGFLPSRLYNLNSTIYLFVPRPTIENKKNDTREINPIFVGYLRYLKAQNKKHLYINVMSHVKEFEDLANSDEFKDTFTIVTMNRDGDCYWQEGEWEFKNNAYEFMQAFKQELFSVNEKYIYWPDAILSQDWPRRVEAIIDQTYQEYFHCKTLLDQNERMAFIEIVFGKLIEAMRDIIQPDYLNETCRYTNDRGPSQFSFDYAFDLIKKYGKMNAEEKRLFLTFNFVPSLVSHNRPAHDYRINRLAYVLEILLAKHGS